MCRPPPHPKPPLCKGRWQKSLIFVGGIVRYNPACSPEPSANSLHPTEAIPQSFCILDAKCQLPLHKGALRRSRAIAIESQKIIFNFQFPIFNLPNALSAPTGHLISALRAAFGGCTPRALPSGALRNAPVGAVPEGEASNGSIAPLALPLGELSAQAD